MTEKEQQANEEGNQLEEGPAAEEKVSDEQIGGLTRNIFSPAQTLNVLGMGSENIDNISWQDFNEYLHILDPVSMKDNPYKEFELFEPGEVNIGLCLVYRQEWRPLGNQRGEIIRTIPLGPKQLEKVSTKIVRRTKVTKTAETLKSIESTKEASDTVKDSSEIINEAAETSGMQASVSGSINAGWASVKASAGMQKNSENRSKNLSSKLSETMQKTAGKIRSETKTMVSTESESAYEMTTASEIQNPNEEIAITYVYSKLQRQYEIFTSLAEIHPVVMVPLPIPAPGEIDEKWIRRYDWILAKVLLDDSYRDALTYISQNPVDISVIPSKAQDVLASFNTIRSESDLSKLAPILKDGQPAFMDMLKQNIEQEDQRRIMEYKCERLKDHLKDNILHYYQAIWSQQDSEQQLLKLKKSGIKVPAKWKFIGKFGDTEYGDDVFKNTIYDLLNEVIDYQFKQIEIDEATFEKEIGEGLKRLEEDLIVERDSNIEKERELITQNYTAQIESMTRDHNIACEEEIDEKKNEIRDKALDDSRVKVLETDIDNLIHSLIGDVNSANDSFNNEISNFPYGNYRINKKLTSEGLGGIRDWLDSCLSVVKETPKELLMNPAHMAARKNYLEKLYPNWINAVKSGEQKQAKLQKDTDDLVNSLIKDVNKRNNEYNGKIKKEIFGKWWIKEKLKSKSLSGVKDWCNRCCNFVKQSPSVLAFHIGYGNFRPKYKGSIYNGWMKRIADGEKNQAMVQKDIANLVGNLIKEIGNANNFYNNQVSGFPAQFRINERLNSENLSEIKDWFDRCLKVVEKSPPDLPSYTAHRNARTNYIGTLYPKWIKAVEDGDHKQADLQVLNDSIDESITNEQEKTATEVKEKYITAIAENTANLESERDGKINEASRDITEFYATEIPKRKKWLRKKLIRELKEDIDFEGDFIKFSADDIKKMKLSPQKAEVDITEIMNPAGPIAYHGNYAVYYLKPEVQSSDLITILTVMKTPYLYYTSRDKAPTLVDPLLKKYLKDYDDVVPSMDDRYEMVEYVPDLRLMLSLAQEDSRTFVPQSPDDRDPVEKLLTDDKLFSGYYPEYLFRKELTRRFVVDTNNIILDIEPGRGSALESFKLAHRGIDVQKAVEERDRLKLENKRMIELLSQKKLDSRFWPDAQKFVAFTGDNGMQYGVTPKPTVEGTAAELTAVPIITPGSPQEMTDHHANIYGRVEKAGDHTPVKGAEIRILCLKKTTAKSKETPERIEGMVLKTSANGMFSSEVEDGKYQVLAAAPKFQPASYTVELKEEQRKEFFFNLEPLVSSREYVGNKETLELHKPDCPWVALMDKENKVKFGTLKEALGKRFYKCGHCFE